MNIFLLLLDTILQLDCKHLQENCWQFYLLKPPQFPVPPKPVFIRDLCFHILPASSSMPQVTLPPLNQAQTHVSFNLYITLYLVVRIFVTCFVLLYLLTNLLFFISTVFACFFRPNESFKMLEKGPNLVIDFGVAKPCLMILFYFHDSLLQNVMLKFSILYYFIFFLFKRI